MYALWFEHLGYRALVAYDGARALELALREPPSVIVADLQLPGMDGWELARALRADRRTAAIPLICLTGHSAADLARQATEAGYDCLFEKPCSPERLAEAVGALRARTQTATSLCQSVQRVVARIPLEPPLDAQRLLPPDADAVPVALLLVDQDGVYVDANEAALSLTGFSRSELLARSIWDLTPDVTQVLGRRLWRQLVAAGRQEGTYSLVAADGRTVEVHYCAVANVLPGRHLSALMRAAGPTAERAND